MRSFAIIVVAVTVAGASATFADGKMRLAQTSTATNCMMLCNSQAANCQTGCLVPGTPPSASATTTSNATANTACLMNCSTTQLTCQTSCARQSPSQ